MTKFKYQDLVTIKSGFYGDGQGTVESYYSMKNCWNKHIGYNYTVKIGNKHIYMKEENLQAIGEPIEQDGSCNYCKEGCFRCD